MSNSRRTIINLLPGLLAEKVYYKFFSSQKEQAEKFDNVPLYFVPHVQMKLCPTDAGHKALSSLGFYEYKVSKAIYKIAQQGGILIDVGANYGYYSCMWAGTKPANRAFAFEASPRNVPALQLNIEQNNFAKQVKIIEAAVSNDSKSELLFDMVSSEQTGWGGLTTTASTATIRVPMVTLDEYFASTNEAISVLKIDVEGADYWVLKGAEKMLKNKQIKHIFFEANLSRMEKLQINLEEIIDFLKNLGYKVNSIAPSEYYAHL